MSRDDYQHPTSRVQGASIMSQGRIQAHSWDRYIRHLAWGVLSVRPSSRESSHCLQRYDDCRQYPGEGAPEIYLKSHTIFASTQDQHLGSKPRKYGTRYEVALLPNSLIAHCLSGSDRDLASDFERFRAEILVRQGTQQNCSDLFGNENELTG